MSVPLISCLNIPLTDAPPCSCAADPGATTTFVAGGALKPIGGHAPPSLESHFFCQRAAAMGLHSAIGDAQIPPH